MRDEELAAWTDRATTLLASEGEGSVGVQEFNDLLRGRLKLHREGAAKFDKLRRELLKRYERAIAKKGVSKSKGPRDHLTVHAFGSAVMGLGSRESDLDISIEGTFKGGPLFKTKKGNKAKVLRNLMYTRGRLIRFVRDKKEVVFTTGARIPVVKFVDKPTNIPCDMSIGNTDGIFKSHLLGAILNVDDRFVDLVVLVKLWANANEVKSGSECTFTSFAVTILVTTFLQSKGLLPPLKEILPGAREIVCDEDKSHEMLRYLPKYQIKVDEWVKESRGKASTEMTTGELLVDFFAFLSLFLVRSRVLSSFSNEVLVACPWEGCVRLDAMRKLPSSPMLKIEDPFNPSENCGRSVSMTGLKKILGVLEVVVLEMEALTEQGGDWESFDRMLFTGVNESESVSEAWADWPELETTKNKESLTGIFREVLVDGVQRRGQMENALQMGWLPPNFLSVFREILVAEGVNFHEGLEKSFMLLGDKVGSLGVAEMAVGTMLRDSNEPDVVGDKLRDLASAGRFPTQFRVHYLREATLDSLISFARSNGFECQISPEGRLRFDGWKSSSSVHGLVGSEELNEAVLEDLFVYFLDSFKELDAGQEIMLDLERYVVPGHWVRRVAVRLSKKFLPVSVRRPDSSKEIYRVKKHGGGGARQGRKRSVRVPVAGLCGDALPDRPESRCRAVFPSDVRNSARVLWSRHQPRTSRGIYCRKFAGRMNSTNSHPMRGVRLISRLAVFR